MSDDTLKIARDLVATRAKLRSMVRRLLTRYGYPPDKREDAVHLVLKQAEALGQEWMS
jgi:type I restriction enzyme R subunit